MIINIICDNLNSWFYKYINNLSNNIKNINDSIIINIIDTIEDIPNNSDISFFLSCEKIVKKEIFSKSNNNIVVHASDLPKGKGMSPFTWQILEGKNEIPITLFEMDEKIDNGKWYIKDKIILDGTELIKESQEKLFYKMQEMILTFIKKYPNNKSYNQEGQETIYKRRKPKDSELNINKTINEQFNLLRVCDNEKYPAFFIKNGHKYTLKIYKEKNND